MKFYILAVGNKMPDWVEKGYIEYAKRLSNDFSVHLTEIKPEKRTSGKKTAQILQSERARIVAALPTGCRIVALDECGKQWSTLKLSDQIVTWMNTGEPIAFIIGGADGLHPDIKTKAHHVLALSALTLPHGMVRVLLAEQLYRAVSIIKQHPYHRGST